MKVRSVAAELMRCCGLMLLTVMPLSFALLPTDASAQSEWGADNAGERQREIIRRYLDILERRPEPGSILSRTLAEIESTASLERWTNHYEERALADEDNHRLAILWGHLLVAGERYDEALVAFNLALEREAGSLTAHRGRAQVLRALGRADEARAALEEALSLAREDTERGEILRELANLALDADDYERAAQWYDELVALDPQDVSLRLEFADALIERESFERAIEQYDAIISTSRYDARQRAEALRDRGRVEYRLGDYDRAVTTWREAMELLEPTYWLYRELEAQVVEAYRTLGRSDELIESYEARSSLTRTQRLLLAQLYEERGDLREAVGVLNRALRADPGDVDVRRTLVRLYDRLGERDAARDALREALRYDPTNADLALELALRLRRAGDQEEAVATLNRVERAARNNAAALVTISDGWFRLDEEENALRAVSRAVRAEPRNPDWRVALGEVHFVQGRRSTAEEVWREIVELESSEERGWARLSDVLDSHGLTGEAIDAAERARALSDAPVYVVSLAELLERAGRLGEARAVWQDVYRDEAANAFITRARTQMVSIDLELGMLSGQLALWEMDDDIDERDRALLATGYEMLGDRDAAVAYWEGLRESELFGIEALLSLSDLYRSSQRWSEALAVLQEIVDRQPARARDAWRRAAEISLLLDDVDDALRFAQLGVEANPGDVRAYLELARTEFRVGQLRSALNTTSDALAVDDQSDAVLELRARLQEIAGELGVARSTWLRLLEVTRNPSQVELAGERAMLLSSDVASYAEVWDALEARYRNHPGDDRSLELMLRWLEGVDSFIGAAQDAGSMRHEMAQWGGAVIIEALIGENPGLRERALALVAARCSSGSSGLIVERILAREIGLNDGLDVIEACAFEVSDEQIAALFSAFYADATSRLNRLVLSRVLSMEALPGELNARAQQAAVGEWEPEAGIAALIVGLHDREAAGELADELLAASHVDAVSRGVQLAALSATPSAFMEELRTLARFGRPKEALEAVKMLAYMPVVDAGEGQLFVARRFVLALPEERAAIWRVMVQLEAREESQPQELVDALRMALLAEEGLSEVSPWPLSGVCDEYAESLTEFVANALAEEAAVVDPRLVVLDLFELEPSGEVRSPILGSTGCSSATQRRMAEAVARTADAFEGTTLPLSDGARWRRLTDALR